MVAVWGQVVPGLLVDSFPAQGIGPLELRHRVKFSRINIPDSLSGLRPGAGAKKKNQVPIQAVSWSEGLGPGHQGCSFFFCRGWCHPQASCGQVLIGVRLGARD